MSNCKVCIDNIYHAGAVISGKLICNFNSEKKIRAIKLIIRGKEMTQWTVRESRYDPVTKKHRAHYVYYKGRNDILNAAIILDGDTISTKTVAAGRYEYLFSYQLPMGIPSTFEGTYGSIKYSVTGVVDRPMRLDFEDTEFFQLCSPIDFNVLSYTLQDAVETGDEKIVCCFCCAHGPISMNVFLPKQAYVPGEIMRARVHVSNMSNVNVKKIELRLKQTITYRVQYPSAREKCETDILASFQEGGVGAHGEHTYNCELEVPTQIGIPNFLASKLFTINYILNVECVLPNCHHNLNAKLFPTLGNLPRTTDSYNVVPPPYATVSGISYQNEGPPAYMPMPQPGPHLMPVPLPPASNNDDDWIEVAESRPHKFGVSGPGGSSTSTAPSAPSNQFAENPTAPPNDNAYALPPSYNEVTQESYKH